jgi:hypothetical protein
VFPISPGSERQIGQNKSKSLHINSENYVAESVTVPPYPFAVKAKIRMAFVHTTGRKVITVNTDFRKRVWDMKYIVGILAAFGIFNAFILWAMCAAGAREDRWMEEKLMEMKKNDGEESE